MTGTPTARLAQIRLATFLSDWTVAGLIGDPSQSTLGNNLWPL